MNLHSVIFFVWVKYMKKLSLFLCLILFLSGCASSVTTGNSVNLYESLSNKKQGWGFRRTESGPEFSADQVRLMNEYGCIYKEDTKSKNIYLTFDEGYEKGYTSLILDTLREKGVKAAFFVTGQYVRENPDLIKRMAEEGHIIGNHSLNHPSLPEISSEKLKEELFELDRLVYGACGVHTTFLRAPRGEYSERMLALTRDLGYTNVFWSQAYVDWNDDVSEEEAFTSITGGLHKGCVLLLHAVSKGNAESLGRVIDYAQNEGYVFRSLNEYKN